MLTCFISATVIGDGVYFAFDPNYSAQKTYSPPDANGNRYIYQCKVLVGNGCPGRQGFKEPPFINNVSGPRFDSVNGANNAIVVIFYDNQTYPEYLIKF